MYHRFVDSSLSKSLCVGSWLGMGLGLTGMGGRDLSVLRGIGGGSSNDKRADGEGCVELMEGPEMFKSLESLLWETGIETVSGISPLVREACGLVLNFRGGRGGTSLEEKRDALPLTVECIQLATALLAFWNNQKLISNYINEKIFINIGIKVLLCSLIWWNKTCMWQYDNSGSQD